jgi:hypothetical protein
LRVRVISLKTQVKHKIYHKCHVKEEIPLVQCGWEEIAFSPNGMLCIRVHAFVAVVDTDRVLAESLRYRSHVDGNNFAFLDWEFRFTFSYNIFQIRLLIKFCV